MTFVDKGKYDRLFQKVIQKGGESAINYIKIFQNDKALSISVGNTYSGYQLIHILVYSFQQGGK